VKARSHTRKRVCLLGGCGGMLPPSQKILNLDPLKLLNNIEATVTTYTCTVVFAVITTTNQVGYIIVIAYVLRDLWV